MWLAQGQVRSLLANHPKANGGLADQPQHEEVLGRYECDAQDEEDRNRGPSESLRRRMTRGASRLRCSLRRHSATAPQPKPVVVRAVVGPPNNSMEPARPAAANLVLHRGFG